MSQPAAISGVPEASRIGALDLTRGFAIFGIFMVNIMFFSMTSVEATAPPKSREAGEILSWGIVQLLFEMKFMALFSMLFGMGFVLQLGRAEGDRRPFGWRYGRRLGLLCLMGLVHGLAIWYGDILFVYSVAGALLLLTRKASAKSMLAISAVVLSLAAGIDTFSRSRTEKAAGQTPVQANDDDTPRWLWALKHVEEDPKLLGEAERIAYKEGPWKATFVVRAVDWVGMLVFVYGFHGFIFRVLGLFYLGAALLRFGFFDPARRSMNRNCLGWGICIGLPLEVTGTFLLYRAGDPTSSSAVVAAGLHHVGSVALALAFLGGLAMAARVTRRCLLRRGVESVGRMALTNYLGQSVVAGALMYWWGAGLFGDVSRPALIGIVAAVYGVQAALSLVWLRLFRFGPLEWAWRSWTYLRLQPLLR